MPYPFIEARHYTRGRESPIDVLVVHAMEAAEKPYTAEAVARWFAGPDAPRASCHYCIDVNSIVACVRDEDVAWHAPGANHNGLGFEHAGYSAQTGADWDDGYSRLMLARSARLVASKCGQYGIPPVWLFPADLLAGRRGITSHWNVTRAFQRSDHTDPGPGFPAERYVRAVRRVLERPRPPAETRPKVRRLTGAEQSVRPGEHGWRVRRLQRLLEAGGYESDADGTFGQATLDGVRRLQRTEGLVANGVVDTLTWRALVSGLSERVPAAL